MAEDAAELMAGYYAGIWPAECGGPRRQKIAAQGGLAVSADERLAATPRDTGRWNVMFVWRDESELYLHGTMPPADPHPHGWVERVDPRTLEVIDASPDLPCGGHIWCGAVVVHANGDLYVVNGSYLHRLSPRLAIVAELKLPVDGAHNGILVMPDGNLVTKDLRLSGVPSELTVIEPDRLTVVSQTRMPEPSMGRISADRRRGIDAVYAPGDQHIFRFIYGDGWLRLDENWQPAYRDHGESAHGRAWDTCIGDGSVWLHDNGDVSAVHQIFATHPAGSKEPQPAPNHFTGPQRLIRVAIDDPADIDVTTPFDRPGGFVIAPPLYDPLRHIAVSFDTANGLVGAHRYVRSSGLEQLWTRPVRNSWQPILFQTTGELILDDFTGQPTLDDNLVVLDIETGEEKARCMTGSLRPNGMFPCPGRERDVYYCSAPSVARVFVAPTP
ncbi:MAG: hypothetical protein WEC75_00705 [Dehalococcoidia bacterium]